jgi:RNase adaptor protein for sRNA GlmZ degradation
MNKDIKKIRKKLLQVSEILDNYLGATNMDVEHMQQRVEDMIDSMLEIDEFEMEVEYDDVAFNYGVEGDTNFNKTI